MVRSTSTFTHERLVDQKLAKGFAVPGMVQGLHQRLAASAQPRQWAQSRRGGWTISIMVLTPRPSSPTKRAQAPSNSTSLEALERLPIFFFNR